MGVTDGNWARACATNEPYYQGMDCKKRHGGIRRTDSRACIMCERERSRDKYNYSRALVDDDCRPRLNPESAWAKADYAPDDLNVTD